MCHCTERCFPSPNYDGSGVFQKGGERKVGMVRVHKDFPMLIRRNAPLDYTLTDVFLNQPGMTVIGLTNVDKLDFKV